MNESIQAAEMMGSDVSDICGSSVGAPVHATERKVLAGRGFGEPDFHQLEPDGELATPTPGAPTSRIVKRGRSLRSTSS